MFPIGLRVIVMYQGVTGFWTLSIVSQAGMRKNREFVIAMVNRKSVDIPPSLWLDPLSNFIDFTMCYQHRNVTSMPCNFFP
jgi:hypothetical protein